MSTSKTMDFFAHQDATRAATRRLVILFAFSVVCIVAAVCGAVLLFFGSQIDHPMHATVTTAAVTGAVILIGSLVRMDKLRGGGPAVAKMLGGREVRPATRDDAEQRLVNVVEEMAIASGLPVPRIFVLEDQKGINAFAAGLTTRDATIAVTDGALRCLDREELQGVVAHEFSHIFHGDMRLNTRLIGGLAGILCLVTIGELAIRILRNSRGKRTQIEVAIALFGLTLMVIGSIGALFARLIKAAVSRQREYLADASAVAYTRNPNGLARALWRIRTGSPAIVVPGAREASHLFFADSFARWANGWTSTHPPVELRIERLMPGFLDSVRKGRMSSALDPGAKPSETVQERAAAMGLVSDSGPRRMVMAEKALARIGVADATEVTVARTLLSLLPEEVKAAARDPERVASVAIALVAAGEPGKQAGATGFDKMLTSLPITAKIPLAEICAPTIAAMPEGKRAELRESLRAAVDQDGKISHFEMALMCMLSRQAASSGSPSNKGRELNLFDVESEIETVLSWMAHQDTKNASRAFARGKKAIVGVRELKLLEEASVRGADAERAMARIARVSPRGKRMLLTALTEIAAHDRVIAPEEGELLRAFAACWDCPMPPLWAGDGSDPS